MWSDQAVGGKKADSVPLTAHNSTDFSTNTGISVLTDSHRPIWNYFLFCLFVSFSSDVQ